MRVARRVRCQSDLTAGAPAVVEDGREFTGYRGSQCFHIPWGGK